MCVNVLLLDIALNGVGILGYFYANQVGSKDIAQNIAKDNTKISDIHQIMFGQGKMNYLQNRSPVVAGLNKLILNNVQKDMFHRMMNKRRRRS